LTVLTEDAGRAAIAAIERVALRTHDRSPLPSAMDDRRGERLFCFIVRDLRGSMSASPNDLVVDFALGTAAFW
jgi:hypothetical protein